MITDYKKILMTLWQNNESIYKHNEAVVYLLLPFHTRDSNSQHDKSENDTKSHAYPYHHQ